jgi:hypothetical protein
MSLLPARRLGRGPLGALAGIALLLAAPVPAAPRPPADPAQFSYAALPDGGTVAFRIGAGESTFEFKTGPSPYRAFRLPASERAYVVEVRGEVENPEDAHRSRVFYPVVALLTEDFLVSRQTDLDALRFDLPFYESARVPAYRVSIAIDPAQAKERYLVVYTPAALLAPRPWPTASTPAEAQEAVRTRWLGASASGRLRITVVVPPGAPAASTAAR